MHYRRSIYLYLVKRRVRKILSFFIGQSIIRKILKYNINKRAEILNYGKEKIYKSLIITIIATDLCFGGFPSSMSDFWVPQAFEQVCYLWWWSVLRVLVVFDLLLRVLPYIFWISILLVQWSATYGTRRVFKWHAKSFVTTKRWGLYRVAPLLHCSSPLDHCSSRFGSYVCIFMCKELFLNAILKFQHFC